MMHAMADKPDQQVVVLCQVSNYILINLSPLMRVGDQAMYGKSLFQWLLTRWLVIVWELHVHQLNLLISRILLCVD